MKRLPNEHWGTSLPRAGPVALLYFPHLGSWSQGSLPAVGVGERSGAPQSWWEEGPSLGSGPHSLPFLGPEEGELSWRVGAAVFPSLRNLCDSGQGCFLCRRTERFRD